jgi:hypothetical protein
MTTGRAYSWKPRVQFPVDPQVAGEELDRIRGHNSGELSPEAVVQAAKEKKSPLHSVFEWDDKKAGHEFRLQQACVLIRSVVVTITPVEGGEKSEPMQVSVKREPRGGGTATAQIIPQEELHRRKVDRGWSALEEWRSEYGSLPEFVGVNAALLGFMAARDAAAEAKAA